MRKKLLIVTSAIICITLFSACRESITPLDQLTESFVDTDNLNAQKSMITEEPVVLDDINEFEIIQIACASDYEIILLDNGTVYAKGNNETGDLGVGDFKKHEGYVRVDIPEKVILIDDCVAVTENNDIYKWGYCYIEDVDTRKALPKAEGWLPVEPLSYRCTPVKIEFGKPIKEINNSWLFTNILTEDGEVYTFGFDYTGYPFQPLEIPPQNFIGGKYYPSDKPQLVEFDEKIVSISSGVEHTLALSESGVLYGYGSTVFNQLGYNLESTQDYMIVSEDKVSKIASSGFASYYVKESEKNKILGTGHLNGDDMNSYYKTEEFVGFQVPNEVDDLFPSRDNSILIKCSDNGIYGLGDFYFDCFGLEGQIETPTKIKENIDAAKIYKYHRDIYFVNEDDDLLFYNKDIKKANEYTFDINGASIDNRDILETSIQN